MPAPANEETDERTDRSVAGLSRGLADPRRTGLPRPLLAECHTAVVAAYRAAGPPLPRASEVMQAAMQRAGELRAAHGLTVPEPSAAEVARADAWIAALRAGRLLPPE